MKLRVARYTALRDIYWSRRGRLANALVISRVQLHLLVCVFSFNKPRRCYRNAKPREIQLFSLNRPCNAANDRLASRQVLTSKSHLIRLNLNCVSLCPIALTCAYLNLNLTLTNEWIRWNCKPISSFPCNQNSKTDTLRHKNVCYCHCSVPRFPIYK